MFFGLFILLSPYWIYTFLKGVTLVKNLIEEEWTQNRGLEKVVRKLEKANPEVRMQAEIDLMSEKTNSDYEPEKEVEVEEKTEWIDNPTPEQEEKEMNERVFKEGLLHKLPHTKTEEVSKE